MRTVILWKYEPSMAGGSDSPNWYKKELNDKNREVKKMKSDNLYADIQTQLYNVATAILEDIGLHYKQNFPTALGIMEELEQKIRVMQELNHVITLINQIN